MKKDEIATLVKSGLEELNAALAAGKSARLEELLKVMARFPRYSFRNCLLIEQQRPDATMVQGFHSWKKLGRCVKKGEKGIGIAAPLAFRKKEATSDEKEIRGFRVVHVFDFAQTEGDEMPALVEPTGDSSSWIERLEIAVGEAGIELAYEQLDGGLYGYSGKGRIRVQDGLRPAHRLNVLIHEFAHELMHRSDLTCEATSHRTRETEAEAVAHVVCYSLGVDSLSHSADYIHLHRGDAETLSRSMHRIQKCASHILQGLTGGESLAA